MNLETQTSDTLGKIETYERNWHIFKAILLAVGIIIVVSVQIYTYHRLLDNSNANHHLICDISRLARLNNDEIMKDCK